MTHKQQVIAKMNQNKEEGGHIYSWNTIPNSLKKFWIEYFEQQKKLT